MNSYDPKTKTINLATDHAGFELKELVKGWLQSEGFTVVDHGAKAFVGDDDFTDFIGLAAQAVSLQPEQNLSIIFGGSGQGEAMLANRYPSVRATVYYGGDETVATTARSHNDANILSIGARFVTTDEAKRVIWSWLHEPFSGKERYERRNKKIERLSKNL